MIVYWWGRVGGGRFGFRLVRFVRSRRRCFPFFSFLFFLPLSLSSFLFKLFLDSFSLSLFFILTISFPSWSRFIRFFSSRSRSPSFAFLPLLPLSTRITRYLRFSLLAYTTTTRRSLSLSNFTAFSFFFSAGKASSPNSLSLASTLNRPRRSSLRPSLPFPFTSG